MKRIFYIAGAFLCSYILVTLPPEEIPEMKQTNFPPEAGRPVHSYNWEERKYVYKDEVEPEDTTRVPFEEGYWMDDVIIRTPSKKDSKK